MKKQPKTNKFKSIITDLYYRFNAFPMLLLLWLILIYWNIKIQKQKNKLIKRQLKVDAYWKYSERISGKKYEKLIKSLKSIEKDLLYIENDLNDIEQIYLEKQEKLKYYASKLFDKTLGS